VRVIVTKAGQGQSIVTVGATPPLDLPSCQVYLHCVQKTYTLLFFK